MADHTIPSGTSTDSANIAAREGRMTTVRQRRETSERARLSITKPNPAKERTVYLVTTVKTKTHIDADTGEPVAEHRYDATVQDNEAEVDRMLELKAAGDERLANTKVFRMQINPKGRPTIGSERRK